MNNIIIGQYVPGSSFLYKMDPRSKIIALFLLMISTFILTDVLHILIMLALILVLLWFGGIPIGRIVRGLRPIMILLTFTFVFQILFVKTGTLLTSIQLTFSLFNILIMAGLIVLYAITKKYIRYRVLYFIAFFALIIAFLANFSLGQVFSTPIINVYTDGIKGAFFIMIRLVIIVTLSTILTLTTKPTDLTLGLEQLLKPLSIIKISAEEIALIISIALRYIPTLLDEANKIMLAQASRGVDFSEGKLKDKIMQIISLLVPMFIISFKRSDELANAMEARNFVPGKKRTRLHVLRWSFMDSVVIATSSAFIIASILIVTVFS
ncbi:energy-coupling factor transporter transmembrane component T family protein [Candidatus Xianfuyuplasma coldseepsis]|uniref:Energy-coupling factor transporter transmembrane protein EcfT n=1 Tax=Candidatus Xianfuyuplasma coldseepsis TaxID=2782163 RepID=A0A7L7KR63_9MOLU|nr:energy-coupling factor transporter transmembrane component T [Xianfuyuplasma coldseepsis]QMS85213.1 energy-coupling factor transporter transmembrane protein EcfT [Xianfuyuplasma coldseepsis]